MAHADTEKTVARGCLSSHAASELCVVAASARHCVCSEQVTMEALQLDPATAQAYATFYKMADEDHDGQVGFQDAITFFSKSNLSKDVLAQVWAQVRSL